MDNVIKEAVPHIEELSVKNYRALRDLQLKDLTPLTVFLGPNGSGKSTIFDVFAFLSECFSVGLRKAWDKRGRFKELRTRGADGPIVFELKYREKPQLPIITYHLAIEETETPRGPYVAEEWLTWRRGARGRPFRFLDFEEGSGQVISGEEPDERDQRIEERLDSSEMIAVNTLGQFAKHPRVSALRRFITGWYLSYLTADNTRVTPEAGPQERLSATGNNLPNVIQFLREQHKDRLDQILRTLSNRVPQLEKVDAEMMADGRLLLQIKDAPFERPILAKFASDGTLKMLAYLIVLYDPDPPQLVGIEEPENHLHPRLLPELAEECRGASDRTQLMVTTHSPFFVNGLRSEELWVLYRDVSGYTKAKRAADMPGIKEFMNQGALLGHLWMEGNFEFGDPLTAAGGPKA
ncbi:MAG: ATPase [Deltaproteobacteria bacterium RBG_13_52_11]|nr:MAG: ATPase [Deltaproteobacteria bacterium RBG_13_52_11]